MALDNSYDLFYYTAYHYDMSNELDIIQPHKAYKLNEAGKYLNLHPVNIRKILNSDTDEREQFVQQFHPVKVAGQWRILGENILIGLGSVSYNEYLKNIGSTSQNTGGAASPFDYQGDK